MVALISNFEAIHARAPLRLGLAGGGTDVSPYCDVYGGIVLNATIDKYIHVLISPIDNKNVEFVSVDKGIADSLPLSDYESGSSILPLHSAVYRRIVKDYNSNVPISIKICSYSEAPSGSGLGSSSTLVVALIRAFCELLNLPLDDYHIAHLAFEIERIDCNLRGGRQDQFSATFGGFNYIEFFKNNRVVVNPLRIKPSIINELESLLILYFTGLSRDSDEIILEQSNNLNAEDTVALDSMHQIKNQAIIMKESLLKGDFRRLISSLADGWRHKKGSAKSVSNEIIETAYNVAISAGALAGKVSGAGGGGFMMFLVPLESRLEVYRSLASLGGEVSNCRISKVGAEAWRTQMRL
jgi:D-glycero-alpha-D-manno-heptose-7-phosphate kinase